MAELHHYLLGDLALEYGDVLRSASLAYSTFGQLNAARDNAVLLPSYYTGTHASYSSWIGTARALDPAEYFIIAVNLFGNGLSTSPSNSEHQGGSSFPRVTLGDNVDAQHQLLSKGLGIESLALVAGWSMGAMQAFHWAIHHPEYVRSMLAVCGTARCWPLNQVFLQGVRGALQADNTFDGGDYLKPPERGLRAFGRAYAGWAYSAEFFREALYKSMGFDSLDALLTDWEQDHCQHDANDLLAVLWAWHDADPSRSRHGGRLADALQQVSTRCMIMPSTSDAYFTLEEARLEYENLPNADWRPLESPYGHCAGAPGRFAKEHAAVEQAIRELLSHP